MHTGVHNNIALSNANNIYKINTGKKAKSSEKLASGYKLNRSADDTAGMAISEKMRYQIRGLNKGTANAQDGISWVQTGDGALNEMHALLQRMRELTIQSLNDTNTESDRAACQAEFDALQSEIDRISKGTQFNTQNIFDEHELPYYQCEGNVEWQQYEKHIVSGNKNDLIIQYRTNAADTAKEIKIEVPAGVYTTQELMDEIEDAAIAKGFDKEGIMLEFTPDGTCNLNLEGGEVIDAIGGGLSYLFYDMYEGGGFGALIGTTVFINDTVKLEIKDPNNNHLKFSIEDFAGNSQVVDFKIPDGKYTKQDLINILNTQLQGTDVTAVEYGTGIKLEGKDSIVTGFKGNMFKIDDGSKIYHSVFYDNVSYGNITMEPASFKGGAIKPTSDNSEEYQKFVITSSNNQLVLKPNGAAQATTITIPPDTYTVTQMKEKLNELFANEQLDLEVIEFTENGYKGLQINSNVEGVTSSVGIDSTSSAYNTLFTKKEYNSISWIYPKKDSNSDIDASVVGAKAITSAITLTSANNQFDVKVKTSNGTETVTTLILEEKTYQTVDELAAEINAKLADASIDATAAATTNSNYVKITANAGSGITNISVSAVNGNTGYDDIFVKKTITYTQQSISGTGEVTLPEDIPAGGFDANNNKLNISVNGKNYTVNLPTGTTDKDTIKNAIEAAIPEVTTTTYNEFNSVTGTGTSTDRNFKRQDTGVTDIDDESYHASGNSKEIEGAPGVYEDNVPAKITMKYALPDSIAIDDTCNNLQLNINGEEKSISIANGTYTPAQLVNALQTEMDKDSKFGKYSDGATVSLTSDNKLVFTVRLKDANGNEVSGIDTSISCNTDNSNLLEKIHTTEEPAWIESGTNILSGFTITDQNNAFEFTLNGQKVSVQLPKGLYATPAAFVSELNKAFDQAGHKVTASLNNGKLRLTTDEVGKDTSIAYESKNGGSSSLAIFGDLTQEAPAEITLDRAIQEEITIDNSSNQLTIAINGTSHTLTLANGTYDRSSFLNMLNGQLKNKGVTASLTNNMLKLTTDATGTSAKLSMNYNSGGSSMLAIYGKTTTVTSGVIAEFDADDKLVLKGTQGGEEIKVISSQNSGLLKPKENINSTYPKTTNGYSSTMKSYIDGRSLTEPIIIDQYSNNLTFTYTENNTPATVSFEVPAQTYQTYADLEAVLKREIEADIGTGKLNVTVDAGGIFIEAANPGNKYYMSGFSGDFYNKMICNYSKQEVTLTPKIKNGSQNEDLAYTVGRKDIRHQETLIRSGVNDTLALDFTYGNQSIPLEFKLDAGKYSSEALVQEIQKKMNEKLVAANLAENLIEVGIGGVYTGVSGSNDDNALVFKLSDSVKLPAEGEYIIDGVRGNAAFSVFYQTDGELEPAYLGGTKDISNGVTIKDGEGELSFKVDGTKYSITIPKGDYTAEEIVQKMNDLLSGANPSIPAVAENYKNTIRLTYPSLGKHTISDVSGGAKEEVFFQENGENGTRKGVMIQLSSDSQNNLEIDRPIVNTSFLKINSVAITRPKYANKALQRVDDAIGRVSEIRSDFGSMQNRLEHAVNNNQNASENTQAAESRIRDTDMATEMVENAKYAILQQATESVMAQAKLQAQNILKLLQM